MTMEFRTNHKGVLNKLHETSCNDDNGLHTTTRDFQTNYKELYSLTREFKTNYKSLSNEIQVSYTMTLAG